MSDLYYSPFIPAFSNIGVPIAEARLYFFYTQTTTLAPIYADSGQTVPLANPVSANLAGKFPDIYLDSTIVYRVRQTDSLGVILGDEVDPYYPGTVVANVDSVIRADLASSGSGKGTGLSTYAPQWVGSVPRSLQDKLKEAVSVGDFGCPGNGTGDLGLALQYIHDNVLGADGGAIRLPSGRSGGGNYPLLTPVVFTKPVELVGEGGRINCEILISTSLGSSSAITTTNFIRLTDLGITAIGSGLNTGVLVDQVFPSNSQNGSGASHCSFSGGAVCWRSLDASQMSFTSVEFGNYRDYGLWSEDQFSSDRGDSFISHCVFAGRSTATGLFVKNAGLYVAACKWNGNQQYAVRLDSAAGNIGDYTFVGNSLEGYTLGGIYCVGANINTKILITGNQFSSNVGANAYLYFGQNVQNVTVTGNTFNDQGSTATGILYGNGLKEVVIVGNHFYDINTAIQGPGTVSANIGLTIESNRFAETVGTIYSSGENPDLLNAQSSQKLFKLSRVVSTSSNSVYANAWRFQGVGTVKITVFSYLQGVGRSQYYGEFLCDGTTAPTVIGTPVTKSGPFDVQCIYSVPNIVVGIKRNGATGTSVAGYVQIELDGYFNYIAKV